MPPPAITGVITAAPIRPAFCDRPSLASAAACRASSRAFGRAFRMPRMMSRRRREDERRPLEADAAEEHQRLIGDPVRKVDLQAQEGRERRALEGRPADPNIERDAQEVEGNPGEPEGEDQKGKGGKMKRRGRAPDEAEGIALHG
jgi:hypothetical protein